MRHVLERRGARAVCFLATLGICLVMGGRLIALPRQAHQVTPDPGSAVGAKLLPHVASWRVLVERPDGSRHENGVWTDTFELIEHGEYRLLRFEQSFVDASGERVTHNVFLNQYPSLVPVHAELNLASGRLLTDYFGAEIHGSLHRTGEPGPSSFRHSLELPAYDFSMGGYLLLDREWSPGTRVSAPFYEGTIDGGSGVRWIDISIAAAETIEFAGAAIETHLVEVPSLGWRMWMVPRPPYVVRSAVPRRDGGTTWFELLRYE